MWVLGDVGFGLVFLFSFVFLIDCICFKKLLCLYYCSYVFLFSPIFPSVFLVWELWILYEFSCVFSYFSLYCLVFLLFSGLRTMDFASVCLWFPVFFLFFLFCLVFLLFSGVRTMDFASVCLCFPIFSYFFLFCLVFLLFSGLILFVPIFFLFFPIFSYFWNLFVYYFFTIFGIPIPIFPPPGSYFFWIPILDSYFFPFFFVFN